MQWRLLRADPQGAFPEAVSTLGLFSHYLYPCKCASQIPANTLGFVMLFNSLNHLNEIFMFPSLLEQSPRFPEISLSLAFKDSPPGGGSSLPETPGTWPAEGLWERSSKEEGLEDTSPGLLLGSWEYSVELARSRVCELGPWV